MTVKDPRDTIDTKPCQFHCGAYCCAETCCFVDKHEFAHRCVYHHEQLILFSNKQLNEPSIDYVSVVESDECSRHKCKLVPVCPQCRPEILYKEPAKALLGDEEIDLFIHECIETIQTKGKDYTLGDKDRLHNFKTVGSFLSLDMAKVWSVYFYKHVSAIFAFVKNGGKLESEPIEGRIKDCIVYLLLFYKMVKEMQKSK